MTSQDPIRDAQEEMELAERVGRQGDPHRAAIQYQSIGDRLRAQLGPYHSLTLDAYEGMARWIGAEGRN